MGLAHSRTRWTLALPNSSIASGGQGGRAGGIYALFADEHGEAGQEVHADVDPKVYWLSVADGTRTPDLLEDRAAKYLPDQNILQVNGDFRVFTDMIDRWAERYEDVPGARDVIEHVVHEWFEQALVETVLGALALKGSPQWTEAAFPDSSSRALATDET